MMPSYSREDALLLIEQLKGYLDRKRVENGEPRSPEELLRAGPSDAELSAELAQSDAAEARLSKSDSLKKLRRHFGRRNLYGFESELAGVRREFRDYWQLSRKLETRRTRVVNALRKCAKVIQDNDIEMALHPGDSSLDINATVFRRTFTDPMIGALEAAVTEPGNAAWGANQASRAILAALIATDAPNCLIGILNEMAREIERGKPPKYYALVAGIRSRNGAEIDYVKRRVFALITERFPDWPSKNRLTADIVNALLLLPGPGGKAVNENDIAKMTEKDRKAAEKRLSRPNARLISLMSGYKRG